MAQSDARNLKRRWIAGGVAGNLVATGIKKGDLLAYVGGFTLVEGVPNTFNVLNDLTSQFTVSADNQINNTGGTSSAGGVLLVEWIPRDPRR